ncbi:molybdate ABC transporter substrate-binding protein [Corynebacterium confusum]
MMKRVLAGCAAAATLFAAACAPSTESASDSNADSTTGSDSSVELNVLAASSTRVLNDDLQAAADELDPPAELKFQNAGSSDLVSQLKEGAPGDLLLTASKKIMDDAVEAGTVQDPKVLAGNEMVMVVPKGNPAGIKSVNDITDETRFVLCDPQVPCGDISQQIIEDKDLDIQPDSQEHQVADVLGKVVSSEADAGWVYSTDAAAAGDDVESITIEGADKFTNQILSALVTTSSEQDSAQQVLDLLADDFDATWEEYGFTPAD